MKVRVHVIPMSSYKLKVKLKGIEPAVTRTISVPKDITFRDLHNILQVAMGWKGISGR